MASSMASSIARRGFRLASSSILLVRRFQSPLNLSPAPISLSRAILGAQTAEIPYCLRTIPSAFFATSSASRNADTGLKKVLESEIQCAQEDVEEDQTTLPKNFPFTIIDNPGDQTVTLKRQYGSENIEVTVFMEVNEGEEGAEEDKEGDEESGNERESETLSNISLVVSIDKGQGKTLEFCCSLGPEEINIDSLTLKSPDVSEDQSPYEGPEFTDLDEQLQKEFYTFLDRRGIKPSLAEFLQDFMIKKEEREYISWLKNMKDFIEK